ncbi:dihydroneopterin aldolase [Campylobacter sp. VBCF_05 NA6]|uniref:dihydroneopterin aldolase n=1 Tax=unclassified Campylobacter TaxID=2593542 RepID=UPI0022E9CDD9|nr:MULTISPECIES: dihydroneopterin aldolase [unclassified Campylobacter]MDA3058167.1 dihydroneopterin aldolase [Campylobacter sp. VBCF_04 NA7]MDA3059738.1 dihydroneopterin aldolase [Campylobacter sp. VBCF_05 NA6]
MIQVLIEDLKFDAIVGILDFEREKKQEILVSAKFSADEFIDYAKACEFIKFSFEREKFLLVEDALNFFAKSFKTQYKSLNYFYMKIYKTQILADAKVGAQIEINF